MALRIEDYALIGDLHTAALVGNDGSIDWLCLPRFDSPACFTALVGTAEDGYWKIAPAESVRSVSRRYRGDTLILETTFACDGGAVTVVDAMVGGQERRVVRSVRGVRGRVSMRMEYVVRFDYGSVMPWVTQVPEGLLAVAGPDALLLASDVPTHAEGFTTTAEFWVAAGETVGFELTYFASHEATPKPRTRGGLAKAAREWDAWAASCTYAGPYRDRVVRSLLTLKALTYRPTGGIVAAPTTSLPELIGGVRNWDYRFCWLRDATFTLFALFTGGSLAAASEWRHWLLRAVAGAPKDLQIVYSVLGARRIAENELPWLAGYERSRPVRTGNAADGQFQLDVYGEVIDLLYASVCFGLKASADQWALSKAIVGEVERRWREPDRGLWEMRGDPRHFVHSKMMAWVALDRAVKSVEEHGLDGPVDRWRSVRDEIHADICEHGFDRERMTFVQSYGSSELDASLLLAAMVGFLPPDDPRIAGTIAAIERELLVDGLVMRYSQVASSGEDGLPPGEGAFLACSFWLVDNYALAGRRDEATALFERLAGLSNDVGLLAEEYDPIGKRLLGNFPQAFSHVGLINSAMNLATDRGPANRRRSQLSVASGVSEAKKTRAPRTNAKRRKAAKRSR